MNLRLKELREAHGLSVRQMHERLGVQDSRYRKWESESAQIPISYAIACCDILHCTLDELAGRKPISLPVDERRLLALYRATDARGRTAIMALAESQAGMDGESDSGQRSGAVNE